MKKISLFLFYTILLNTSLFSQCIKTWSAYDSDGKFGIGTVSSSTKKKKLTANEHSVVNLTFEFEDIDVYTSSCSKISNLEIRDFDGEYKMTFTIKAKDDVASFSPNAIQKTVTVLTRPFSNIKDANGKLAYILYQNAALIKLYFNNTWAVGKKNVDIEVKVEDVTPFKTDSYNLGDRKDDSAKFTAYTFTYTPTINCPQNIIGIVGNPADNTWHNVLTSGGAGTYLDYDYQLTPDALINGISDYNNFRRFH